MSISDDNELGAIIQQVNTHFERLKSEHGDAHEAARRMDSILDGMNQIHPKHRPTLEKARSKYREMGRRA